MLPAEGLRGGVDKDKLGLRRLVDLDKSFFGGGTTRRSGHATPNELGATGEDSGLSLPSIHAARMQSSSAEVSPQGLKGSAVTGVGGGGGGSGLKGTGRLLPSASPVPPGRNGISAAAPGGAPTVKRKANFSSLQIDSNPYESVVDAAPAMQYLGRDGRLLELLLPARVSKDMLSLLEVDLQSFLAEHLNGLLGSRVDSSNPPVAAYSYAAPGYGASGYASACASPVRQLRQQPTVYSSIDTDTGVGPPVWLASPALRRGGGAATGGDAVSPHVSPTRLSQNLGNTIGLHAFPPAQLQQLPGCFSVPSSPSRWHAAEGQQMTQQLPAISGGPSPGYAWGASPSSTGPLTLGLAALGQEGGMGHGGGGFYPPVEETVNLGRMIGEKHSQRREVQLMAEWLDGCIASAWMAHADAMETAFTLRLQDQGGQSGLQSSGRAVSVPLPACPSHLSVDCSAPPAIQVGTASSLASLMTTATQHQMAMAGMTGGGGGAAAAAAAAALSAAAAATPDPATKRSLAARFAAIVASDPQVLVAGVMPGPSGPAPGLGALPGSGPAFGSPALWSSILQAVTACASNLAQHMAQSCFEEGVLLARLWNLQTSLMDAELAAVQSQSAGLADEVGDLEEQVRRLSPLIEWEREATAEIGTLRTELAETKRSLALATSERNSLLRENSKIILHYRNELKNMRAQQRQDAFRLARKVRYAQEQLTLMQHDRDQLADVVAFTRGQTKMMGEVVNTMVEASSRANAEAEEAGIPTEKLPELRALESGLQNISDSVANVHQANEKAEDTYFATEEKMSIMVARDDVDDSFVDQVLAMGDPEGKIDATHFFIPATRRTEQVSLPGMDADGHRGDERRGPHGRRKPGKKLTHQVTHKAHVGGASMRHKKGDDKSAELKRALSKKIKPGGSDEGRSSNAGDSDKSRLFSGRSNRAVMDASSRATSRAPSRAASARSSLGGRAEEGEGEGEVTERLQEEVTVGEAAAVTGGGAEEGERLREEVERLTGEVEEARGKLKEAAAQLEEARAKLEGSRAAEEEAGRQLEETARRLEEAGGRAAELDKKIQEMESIDHEGMAAHSVTTGLAKKGIELRVEAGKKPLQMVVYALVTFIHDLQALVNPGQSAPPQSPVKPLPPPVREEPSAPAAAPSPPPAAATPQLEPEDAGATTDDGGASGPEGPAGPPAKGRKKKAKGRRTSAAGTQQPRPPANAGAPAAAAGPRVVSAPVSHAASAALSDAAGAAAAAGAAKPFRSPEGPPTLGRERREKPTVSGHQRLAEAVAKNEGIKPRTTDWLIKLIDGLYKAKIAHDDGRAKTGLEPLAMVDFLFQHLSGTYGTGDLVNQYAAQVVATVEACKGLPDTRFATFQRFLTETWPRRVLCVYLDGLRALSEPARVPCCDFPPDYAPRKGAPVLADVRKCFWVADKVLMKRHAKTAYAFAAALVAKGEAISEKELNQFFVAPGYHGPDIATLKGYEKGRAEFRRIQVSLFLEAMCEEHRRCEKVYMDLLPSIFRRWDRDADGCLDRGDIAALVQHVTPTGTKGEELEQAANRLWGEMVRQETLAARVSGSGAPAANGRSISNGGAAGPGAGAEAPLSLPPELTTMSAAEGLGGGKGGAAPPVLAGSHAFIEAALSSNGDVLRGYVRLYKTPPAKVRLDNTAEERVRGLLYILAARHWRMHAPSLGPALRGLGPALEQKVALQVEAMVREQDGMRKALTLVSLLKTLLNRKVDRLVEMMAKGEGQALTVDAGFEDALVGLTTATKVLYGAPVILVDEVLERSAWEPQGAGGCVGLELHHRRMTQVLKLYHKVKAEMPRASQSFLGSNHVVKAWIRRRRRARQLELQLQQATALKEEQQQQQQQQQQQDEEAALDKQQQQQQ